MNCNNGSIIHSSRWNFEYLYYFQILLAHKNARFLSQWLAGYKKYKPSNWYYNAGQYPTQQVLAKQPNLAHRVPDLFGVQNLSNELYSSNNWTDWKEYYSIHLLSRHPPAPDYLDELAIKKMNTSFADIVRFILFTWFFTILWYIFCTRTLFFKST